MANSNSDRIKFNLVVLAPAVIELTFRPFALPLWSAEEEKKEKQNENQSRDPPKPVDASRFDRLRRKFLLHEFVVVKMLVGDAEVVGVGGIRPAGFFIGAAFGAAFCVARHIRAAVGTSLRGHLRFTIYDLRGCRFFVGHRIICDS